MSRSTATETAPVVESATESLRATIARLRELDQERQQLHDQLVADATQRMNQAVNELKELGQEVYIQHGPLPTVEVPSVIEGGPVNGATEAPTVEERPHGPRACAYCGFATDPPHDHRKHRGQYTKKPFTKTELASKGLTRIP